MNSQTIQVRFKEPVCFIRFQRPEQKNTINDVMIEEFHQALSICEKSSSVVVLEASGEYFCNGADFQEIQKNKNGHQYSDRGPELLYELWQKMATGPYVTISHIKGKTNAGGIGFVAASDIVIANQNATFGLSELLFGLYPACVLPFLLRRIGFQKANYLTLMTQPISSKEAQSWGLVDALEDQSDILLRKHLLRLTRLSVSSITKYKCYINELNYVLSESKQMAIAANKEIFSDPNNLEGIYRFVEKGQFPWQA